MKNIRNIAKKIAGVLLVIIGLLALITPLTPGAWLGLIGLELLGMRQKALDIWKKVFFVYTKK